ncbi:efflux RND transporter permease subunit [Aliiroseovarius sp. PTFE2010]|uniref:efflux RND transporter permease subunit n=1 Tax=Aliiroseovarius sp. PTFE2010 TaxID=3417190 RepID=UPI003CEA0E73
MRSSERIGGILGYFARHRTAANLLLVTLLVAGLAAIPNMRAQFFPDIVSDEVRVTVTWDGAGADDVDRAIVQVLEPSLLAVEGVVEAESVSTEGRAQISLEFEPGYDMTLAGDDVEAAVDTVTTLPEGADDPNVVSGGWRERVTDVVITGPVGVDQLGVFADEFVSRLFAEGVTRTTVSGVAAPSTIIEVPSLALIRNDISMAQIAAAVAGEVDTDPAGDVSGANARVRTGVAKRSAEQIEGIVLRSNADGSTLTIGDVATVRVEGIDRNAAYFVGDNPAVVVGVQRSAAGDAIEIQRQVEDIAAEMELSLPDGVHLDLIRTRAEAITNRLNILLDNGAMGLALVVGLLFLFLNTRTAFWVAAGIPVSMTAAIGLMYAFGLTLNMISLFALIITLGIVVDDAIVVGEHVDFRVRRRGEAPMEAAVNAARRMFSPVFSATLTTVIAFFGLTAISGRFGDMIADIPFTVIVVLIASLVECFLILPNHMAHSMAPSSRGKWYDAPSRTVNRGFNWFRERIFRPMMAGVIQARYPVLAGVVLLLLLQVAQVVRGDVQWRFFNSPERPSVSGNFAMAPGAAREDTIEMMHELQRATEVAAQKLEAEHGVNPLDYVVAQIGGGSGRGLASADTKDPDQLGAISIELIDADLRPYSSYAFITAVQEEVKNHPLVEEVSFRGWRSGPGGDAIDIQLYGAEAQVLKDAAEALKTQLSQFPEVSALEDSLAYDKQELVLDLTAQGQALGFTIDAVGGVLRNRLAGIEAASYPDGTRSATINVELPDSELTADFLDRTLMRTDSGAYVPLSDLVSVTTQTGFSTVRRENGIRLVGVNGDLAEDDPARATEVTQALETVILPQLAEDFGISYQMAGLSEQENRFLSDAGFGFALCIVGIYLVLAWVFSSWTRPLVVMAIIPFGLVGAIYGHALWNVPLSMFSVVGLIGMTGIIINDSIVLVTTVDEYAQERGIVPAIIDGSADRLRPVMLTTLTTVLGLAPLLYEGSADAQFLKPTVITLVYGLGFGMVLVLLVVPALLAMQLDVRRQIASFRRGFDRRTGPVRVVLGLAAALVAVWFTATMGSVMLTGAMPALLGGGAGIRGAFGLFVAGAAVVTLATAVLGGVWMRSARRTV